MVENNSKKTSISLIILCAVLTAGIFVLQYFLPFVINSSILYVGVVLLTLFMPGKRYALVFTFISTLLTVVSFTIHYQKIVDEHNLSTVVTNRIFSLIGIWAAFYIIRRVKATSVQYTRTNERMDALFQHATEGIVITGGKGEIIMANPEAEKQFGYSKEELIGKRIEMLIPQRYSEGHVQHRKNYYQKPHARYMGAGMDLYAKRKNGTEFPVEISLSSFVTSEGMFVVSFVIDITQRKKQEEAIRREKGVAQLYLEVAPVIFIAVNKEGIVTLINSAGCKILGYNESELIGKNWMQYLVPPDARERSEKIIAEVYSNQDDTMKEYENHIFTKNGERRIILWKITALKNEQGEVIATLRSGEDITEKKAQQDQIYRAHEELKDYSLRLQQSNEELEQFAYISSHDLQEPLRKIQSFGDRLKQKETQISDQGKEYIDRMLNAASRMQNLINDLLAFSRVTSKAKPFEKTDLNYVLKGVLSDLEIAIEKANAKIEIMTQLPTIDADPTQMRQVFQNLISNAIKFRQEDVAPVIRIFNRMVESTNKGEEGKKLLEISIEDNGIGFDEKYTDRIFNIFQRLEGQKYEGSGIGLAICKKIAVRHGGNITAKSEIGKGSTFIINLALNHTT